MNSETINQIVEEAIEETVNEIVEAFVAVDTPVNANLSDQAKQLIEMRQEISLLETQLKGLRQTKSKLEDQLILSLRAAGLSSFRLENGEQITPTELVMWSLPKDDDERNAAFAWIRKHGGSDMVRLTVNPQSLSAFLREKQKDDDGDIPSLFESRTITRVSIRS